MRNSGSGIRCFFEPLIRDPGWTKKSRSGSRMNIPDHISESLETIFWVKNTLNFLMRFRNRDPESFWPWIRDLRWKNSDAGSGINVPGSGRNIPGSGISIPDPQHWKYIWRTGQKNRAWSWKPPASGPSDSSMQNLASLTYMEKNCCS
jgi:hypothetical protein